MIYRNRGKMQRLLVMYAIEELVRQGGKIYPPKYINY